MRYLLKFRRLYLLAVTLLFALPVFSQPKINVQLKKSLDSIIVLDQKYREVLSIIFDASKRDSMARVYHIPAKQLSDSIWSLQAAVDDSNLKFVESVIKKYGYPGKTLVDTPANEAAWYVIQHSDKIDQYLPLIKKAADQKELHFRLYAMMLDRYLMYNNKEQVYGTQATYRQLKNGKKENFIWPIQNPEKVNQLRKEAGFKQTVEENARRLNVKYRIVKLDELLPTVKH